MAPRAPPKRKKTKKRVFLVIGDPNGLPKKFSAIFGAGCQKVCCCSLNGARNRIFYAFWDGVYCLQTSNYNYCFGLVKVIEAMHVCVEVKYLVSILKIQ